MAIVRNSLLSKVNPGLLGEEISESALPNLTDEEMVVAESEIQSATDESMELQSNLDALEDLENVQAAVAEQVAQNDVNLAAIEGEEVPAEGAPMEVVEESQVTSEEGETSTQEEVVAEVPAPAAELNSDSAPEAIVEKTMEIEGAMEAISGILTGSRLHSKEGLYAQLGIKKSGFGIESAMKDPLAAYKESCEGIKDVLGAIGGRIKAHAANVHNQTKRSLHRLVSNMKNMVAMFRHAFSRVQKMDPNLYTVKEGTTNINTHVSFFLFNKGKGSVKARVESIDNVLTAFNSFQKTLTSKPIKETAYDKFIKDFLVKNGLLNAEGLENVIVYPRSSSKVVLVDKDSYKISTASITGKTDAILGSLSAADRINIAKEISSDAFKSYVQAERTVRATEGAISTLANIADTPHGIKGVGKVASSVLQGATNIATQSVFSRTKEVTDEEGNTTQKHEGVDNVKKISNIISGYMQISACLIDTYAQAISSFKALIGSVQVDKAKADEAKAAELAELQKAAEQATSGARA